MTKYTKCEKGEFSPCMPDIDGVCKACVERGDSPQMEQAEASSLSDLLVAVVGRIDEHAKEWENAKAAGETTVMNRCDGKIREARRISQMIGEIIQQGN